MRRIVITGLGLTAPNGNTLAEFRKNLLTGVSGITTIDVRYVAGVWASLLAAAALIAAVAIGALATNILVVNNYRDVETDRRAGKRTLVVRCGRHFARTQFALAHTIALTAPIFLAAHGVASLVTLAVPLAILAVGAIGQYVRLKRAETPQDFLRLLSQSGLYLAAYAVVLSVWIALGK